MRWDPQQYGRYADERARPFLDLLARVGADAPRRVVDLGCGPGTMTAVLASRWPDAVVEGLDSSPEMIASAAALTTDGLTFAVADATEWDGDANVVISNAMLHWVPGHRALVARWARAVPAGGWLAFQVPGNFDSPSHTLIRALAREFAVEQTVRPRDAVGDPAEYAALLLDAGLLVDAWETTYLHVLPGEDPVLDWVRGTALRPVLAALTAADADEFCRRLAARLRSAYPRGPRGTLLPFRRIFAVGHR
ncbi:MAG: trans-aconitate 2-methyltransferase [Jatrophihabitans sp.]